MAVIKKAVVNGVNLNIIETDKFKTNYLSVNFINKLDRSTAAMNALLPRVLRRGTVNYPNMAKINERLELLYAAQISQRVYKRGETQIFGFAAYTLDNAYVPDDTDVLNGTIDLLGEMIFSPAIENGVFKASYVESEKSYLTDDINAKINNKNSYAIWRCHEEMCKNEVFGIPENGTVEEVGAITPEALYEHYKDVLNKSQIEIYFVGKCDFNALLAKLKTIFAPIVHIVSAPLTTAVIRKAGEVREVIEDQPVAQGKLSLGFRTGTVLADGNYHKFSLFCELYGGSPTSKLFMNVREKLSLCYYCRAIPEAQKGIMVVASGIEVANRDKAQSEILLQLDNVKNMVITDEELDSAKRSIINGYTEINDSPASLEGWYMGRMLAGISNSPEEAAALINDVTKEEIAEIAQKITLDTVYFMRGTITGGNDNEN